VPRRTGRGVPLQEAPLARKARQKLGEILVAQGKASQAQVDAALAEAKSRRMRLGEALVGSTACGNADVARALAEQAGLPFFDLSRAEDIAKVDMTRLPADVMKKHFVVAIADPGRLRLVVHERLDVVDALDFIRFRAKSDDIAVGGYASSEQIEDFVKSGGAGGAAPAAPGQKQLYSSSLDKSVDKSVDRSVDKSIDVAGTEPGEGPMIKLSERIIVEAVQGRASDIHIEPTEQSVRLRYRIDGECIIREELPKKLQNALLSRIKLLAGVNIAEKRVPQDGRIKFPVPKLGDDGAPARNEAGEPIVEQVDFRVSTCPAYHGESVVLRVLRPDSVRIGLLNLGFEQDSLDVFNKIIRRPNGIFLVTGPTGSGKTTTLYSALDVLNTPDRKIITAEDPVEYNFDGINQVQIREHIGLTFSAVLKSMLRQAPNIILVGEIRDREVADIAIQAALTGHLVFSTLHTNDAPSAITRLIDMGVKPFLVASSIQAVLAQRLGRVLCPKCKALDDAPDPKFLKLCDIPREEALGRVMKAVGCGVCGGIGYKGRKAIFEMMIMNAEIRDLAFQRSGVSKIRAAAIRGGMRSLLGDGRIKILKGVTTPEEVAKYAQIEGFDPNELAASR
jgi:type IV pilus assembly protein PilB